MFEKIFNIEVFQTVLHLLPQLSRIKNEIALALSQQKHIKHYPLNKITSLFNQLHAQVNLDIRFTLLNMDSSAVLMQSRSIDLIFSAKIHSATARYQLNNSDILCQFTDFKKENKTSFPDSTTKLHLPSPRQSFMN